jgi:hypothetical protein
MSQCLLENESEFHFDLVPTARSGRYLGIACRHSELHSSLVGRISFEESTVLTYRLRSDALFRASRTFAEPVGGELTVLADFGVDDVSLCLLYKNEPIAFGYQAPVAVSADDNAIRRAAIDFKTVVNFRLAMLADIGVTVPLSQVVVTGAALDDRLITALDERFSGRVIRLKFRDGLLPDHLAAKAHTYTVPLGLIVD